MSGFALSGDPFPPEESSASASAGLRRVPAVWTRAGSVREEGRWGWWPCIAFSLPGWTDVVGWAARSTRGVAASRGSWPRQLRRGRLKAGRVPVPYQAPRRPACGVGPMVQRRNWLVGQAPCRRGRPCSDWQAKRRLVLPWGHGRLRKHSFQKPPSIKGTSWLATVAAAIIETNTAAPKAM